MKIGIILGNIAGAVGDTREQWKLEALKEIKGHKEEKLLMECYAAACAGHKYISLGRNVLPPECLKCEGFKLRNNGGSIEFYFE